MFSHESTFRQQRPISIEFNGKVGKAKKARSKSKNRIEELLKELNTLLSKNTLDSDKHSRKSPLGDTETGDHKRTPGFQSRHETLKYS